MTTAPARDPLIAQGYQRCAQLTRKHGTTYYWGVTLLAGEQRRHVHAVYGLCRMADDVVDAPGATTPAQVTATRESLRTFEEDFFTALRGGPTQEPVIAAAATTARECQIDPEAFTRFFAAMSADLTTTAYPSWADLLDYMDGSAAVIGEMMLPVLRPRSADALEPARALGLAFQLTNFLRDVGEDLDRGRVYLPQETLTRFGADPARRRVDDAWRGAMAHEIARARGLYAQADAGIDLLPGRSARCVLTARRLYAQILDRIEAADYDVFSARVRVPTAQKVTTALRHGLGPAVRV